MATPTDGQLREAAGHRGLKLLKSRRRKPGGDYGLYGLATPDGTARLGVGTDGLTATADEIAAYLRRGDAATWASSVEATPARPPAADPPRPADDGAAAEPSRARARPPSAPTHGPRASGRPRPGGGGDPAPSAAPGPDPRPRPRPARAVPAPPSTPELTIRPATRADAPALGSLVPEVESAILAERLAAAQSLGEPVLVADLGGVVGCLGWHVLPTLRHGAVVRMTLLVVAPERRRQGIGRRLVDALAATAAARDLPLMEATSDIAIDNAHGFFRRLGFAQTSYRFTRTPAADPPDATDRQAASDGPARPVG